MAAGRLKPDKITEKVFARYLDEPDMPDVDMVLRSSGELRLSNFLIWQAAYAEFVALDTLWPDFDRRHLWYACELFAQRDRRFGGAMPNPVAPAGSGTSALIDDLIERSVTAARDRRTRTRSRCMLKGSHAPTGRRPRFSDVDFDLIVTGGRDAEYPWWLDEIDGHLVHVSVSVRDADEWLAQTGAAANPGRSASRPPRRCG